MLSVGVPTCGGGRALSGNLPSVCITWQSLDECSVGSSGFLASQSYASALVAGRPVGR